MQNLSRAAKRPPVVDVVIPNFNGAEFLAPCLESVQSQTLAPTNVIVVDDASTDDSCRLLAGVFPDVELVRRPCNGGFAAAVNTGIRRSCAPFIALLNNDTVAHSRWLEQGMYHFAYDDVAAVACLMMRSASGTVDTAGMEFSLNHGPRGRRYGESPEAGHGSCGPCFAPCAGAAIYRRSVFDVCGLFDEDFFAYNEDVDLGFRMQNRGLRTVFCSASAVDHLGGRSFQHLSQRQVYLSVRNELALLAIHLPTHSWWHTWPRLSLHLARAGASYAVKHRRARAWGRGVRDFLREWCLWREKRRAEAQASLVHPKTLIGRFSR